MSFAGRLGSWRGFRALLRTGAPDSVAQYWTRHNVTSHHQFSSAADSTASFHWRNSQYANYLKLMPVAGFDGRSVLDFGCGPGHDLVGFGHFSRCERLVGVDVSSTSVSEARARLGLHGIQVEVICVAPGDPLPFADATFDHIHSSGVLHHVVDLVTVLRELKRVLKPGGTMNVMVYHYNSIWMHLRVAYQRTLLENRFAGMSERERFARSTDGEDCPIARCYEPHEFIEVANAAGFNARFAGTAVSMAELALLPKRFEAIMDPRLPEHSRAFLESLTFDDRQLPMSGGHHAGVDGVYQLTSL